jgi:hypothetical protein
MNTKNDIIKDGKIMIFSFLTTLKIIMNILLKEDGDSFYNRIKLTLLFRNKKN